MAITVVRVRAAVLGILTVDVLVLLVTGVVLFFEYHPPAGDLWDEFAIEPTRSYELARTVTGVHRVAALVALPLAIAAAVLIVVERWPRNRGRARRGAVAIGLGLVATVLFGSFSGPLLAWDQLGLWAVTVGEDWSGYHRLVFEAEDVRFAIVDGAQIALGTLVRWLVVHTVVTGALLAVLLVAAWRRAGRARAGLMSGPRSRRQAVARRDGGGDVGDVGDEPVVPLGPGESRDVGEVTPIGLTRDAAATTRVRVGRGRRAGLLVVLAVLVIGGLGAAVLLAGGGDTDPDEALAAAQASAAEATSFRFTMSNGSVMRLGDAENGTDTTTRSTGEGAWAGARWHVRSGGELESETIVDGTTIYTRYAGFDSEGEVAGDLDDELWEKYEDASMSREDMLQELELMSEEEDGEELGTLEDEGYRDAMDVALAQAVYLGVADGPVGSIAAGGLSMGSTIDAGFSTDPRGFLDAIERMGDPELVDEAAGVTTLATTLAAPDDVTEAVGRPLPEAKVELDVGADDLPVALRLDVAAGGSSSNLEITFSDWNQPVEITIPPDDQIDANPMVDEESLLALRDLTLVWPTELPEGWELTIFSPEETAEMDINDGDCDAVELDWDDWSDESEEGTYLWLLERPLDCALAADPTPFQPGGPGGLPSRPGTIFGTVEVQVGETAVAVDATLEGAELDAVLATLAPVDVQTLIDAVPATFG